MKKKLWWWTIAAMFGCAACSDETTAPVSGGNDVVATNDSYIAFRILSNGSDVTRAWGDDQPSTSFDEGLAAEQVVDCAFIVFFDNSAGKGEYLYYAEADKNDIHLENRETDDENGGKCISLANIVFTVPNTQKQPTDAIIILNGNHTALPVMDQSKPDMWTYAASIRGDDDGENAFHIQVDNTAYLTMSNSVYADAENKVVFTTNVEDKMKPTETEALAAPAVAHVERMAAKVETRFKVNDGEVSFENQKESLDAVVYTPKEKAAALWRGDNGSYAVATGEMPYKVRIHGWSVNGTAPSMSRLKAIAPYVSEHGDYMPPYNGTGTPEEYFTGWNDAENFRSYWAIDNHYGDGHYPTQSRRGIDKKGYMSGGNRVEGFTQSDGSPWSLSYKSYANIRYAGEVLSGVNAWKNGTLLGSTQVKYCTENTIGGDNLQGRRYLTAATHVVVAAQLLFDTPVAKAYPEKNVEVATKETELIGKNLTESEYFSAVADKYRVAGVFYTLNGYKQLALEMLNMALARRTDATKAPDSLWVCRTGDELTAARKATIDDFTVDTDWRSDGMVLLKPKQDIRFFNSNPSGKSIVKRESAGSDYDEKVCYEYTIDFEQWDNDDTDPDNFINYIYAYIAPAQCYAGGRMYYVIPIQHYVRPATGEGNQQVGTYGVVRNHWYRIVVNSVTGIGEPVHKDTDPIVPNFNPDDQYIGFDIHIMPWNIIEQNVDLKPL